MCRILAYVGDPLALDEPLFGADRALVRQAVDPQLMSLLNLGGFGLVAWDGTSEEPERPFSYRTEHLPVYDRNLKALAEKVRATALLAHVRGVVYDPAEVVGPHNVHPFQFAGTSIAMAQNGDLYDFARMRYDLVEHITPELARRIEGTTDTEWLYALVLSQLDDPGGPVDAATAAGAIERALEIVREARARHGIAIQSPVEPRGVRRPLAHRDAVRLRLRLVPRRRLVLRQRARARLHVAVVQRRPGLRDRRRRVAGARRLGDAIDPRGLGAVDARPRDVVRGARVLPDQRGARRRRAPDRLRGAGRMRGSPTPEDLSSIALLRGMAPEALADLAPFFGHRSFAAGEALFAEGEPGDWMLLLASGRVEVGRRMPGNLRRTVAHVGPGEALGELALISRRPRSAGVRAVEESTAWQLDSRAFELLRRDGRAVAIELTRRIGDSALARLRRLYATIAATLEEGAELRRGPGRAPPLGDLCPAPPDHESHLRGTMLFRDLPPGAATHLSQGSRPLAVPRGTLLAAEGLPPDALLVVVRGALESTIRRGHRFQRVGLAGPGRAACHLGVLDAGPSPVDVRAREHSIVLAVPRRRLDELLSSAAGLDRDLTSAIEVDVVRALQVAERPHAAMTTAHVRAEVMAA